jgi:hypothetical protein
MNHLRPTHILLLAVAVLMLLVLASCGAAPAASVAAQSPIPPLPVTLPTLFGEPEIYVPPVENLEEALSCLSSGRTVYGVTLSNSNVRAAAAADACRMGRVPEGRVVRVTDIFALNGRAETSTLVNGIAQIGYVEDILPIFQQNCETCHSDIAQSAGLHVTAYADLMAGGDNGAVIVPGNAAASRLWEQVNTGKMPLIGELTSAEKILIKVWIDSGASETRGQQPSVATVWLQLDDADVDLAEDSCPAGTIPPLTLVGGDLVQFLSCGVAPNEELLATVQSRAPASPSTSTANTASTTAASPAPAAAEDSVASDSVSSSALAATALAGIAAPTLGVAPPSNEDPFLIPRGGFCVEPRLTRLQDERAINDIAFAPDGRMFLALDSPPTGQNVDPLVLLDAFHPSRSIAVYDSVNDSGFGEIFVESSRITGLDYYDGALYVSRAGEVGRIPDGGEYQTLAGGFAVNSQLFHANNGIVVSDGWVYVSAGGVRDGWSDGPIENIGEAAAIDVVAGGNRFAARIVRAPLDQLLSQRSIENFETLARGTRNPYGLTVAPDGRLWFTDNGATNVPEGISAGDEVNVLDPRAVSPGTPEGDTPFYGFPLALSGSGADWYTPPVVDLPNTAAPTGITWAYNTIFYAQYGRDPGLYRLARAGDGRIVAERIVLAWPVLSVATAPDGALWFGTGTGGLYRVTPGCGS